ncbi:phage tail protein [Pseudomonas sp. NPDC087612]|uniref:Phage tail protein n=1 Tax=Pseudomonas vranovensis TaxID=321661 RepID=A0A423DSJ3_9PSED|nr:MULTISPECIES: phage tail protein [Pseudomonas]KJK20357.1 tail fiber protein [Pseudomonas sp. 2(2015)]ROL74708.1 phage tail protein [Pseudomonas vranovensis]UVL62849.1 phage tail protein [Pseudomonas sp. B21-032]UVM57166.1 phage tail protein [Pseudomonas sp. B21-012]SDQ95470.1 Phage tail-collar fibre protein [Pseudomonas sp. UC 17F4]
MSTPLQPVITKAGLAAIWRADNSGLAAEISHVVLGTSGYTPNAEQKSLKAQTAKYPISGGERLGNSQLHLTAVADGDRAFWVREVGFLLSDGTLLAVWSHPTEALAYKPAGTDLLLAYDLSLAALPANSVTIVSGATGLNLTLAAPLAAQASALIAEQLRGLQQQDRLDDQATRQRIAGEQIANLIERMKAAEQRQSTDRDGLLSATVSNAAAVIALQKLVIENMHGA